MIPFISKQSFIVWVFCLFGCFQTINAQVLTRDTIRPQPKKQVEIIRFGDDDGPRSKSKKKKESNGILKVAPFSFILGYFPVLYEHRITDWLSLQAGTGLTFQPAVSELYSILYEDCEDCGGIFDYSYRKSQIGTMLAFSPRLYLSSDCPEDGYIAPEIRTYFRRTGAQQADPTIQYELIRLTDKFDQESVRFTDIMVHYGYQTLYPKLTVDWSVGFGVRKISGKFQELYYDDLSGLYSTGLKKQSFDPRFRFDLGLRIGFQL